MAVTTFLSTTNTFPHHSSSNSLLPSSLTSSSSSLSFSLQKNNVMRQNLLVTFCKSESSSSSSSPCVSKRSFALSLSSALLLSMAGKGEPHAEAAPLEAEDDLELLEKVKKDRKKRLERQGVINSSTKEKGYLQDLVYKLSAVGQAIESNDLNAASSVLGTSTDTDWIKKANSAFTKLSLGPEETEEVDMFNTSISELISSVAQKDVESSKIAFVSSASAFEKWTALTGLDGLLKGL
ncbi:thylakoid lumenal 16.5 kDa protein, chloroplastic [Beta vulgaris subsp. vulgaris]|uniref:thylakoid lumenal 16.5 kDa protein, chloroplastic n=1 Tax=Beta vulgaris subsp. vulgaris TaxID=3555 RepID=UPI0020371C1A|nr:thylakoid lumenal 16.5 kDa protein, chloroplastic [Beta vulgaris subsp. vulgaris]